MAEDQYYENAVDVDGDGQNDDVQYSDTDNDGKYDQILVDTNNDGVADYEINDRDGDGSADQVYVDKDHDGDYDAEYTR